MTRNLFTRAPTREVSAQLQRIDEALKDKPRLGGESAPATPARAPAPPLTPAEMQMLQQLRVQVLPLLLLLLHHQLLLLLLLLLLQL